jgi:hypothetical protein
MKNIASSITDQREIVLEKLGTAVASVPFDADKVVAAMDEVKTVGGVELCIEAAATCGAFESITKVVDATGRKTASREVERLKAIVMTISKHRNVIVMVGGLVTAVISASRLRR